MTQFQIECIESKSKGPREQYGQFIIEPLKQGQGLTIGVKHAALHSNMKKLCTFEHSFLNKNI